MNFLNRILKKPPVLFPWVALFHAGLLVYVLFSFLAEKPFLPSLWLQPVWALAYFMTWLFACDLKKWAAYGYLFVTVASLLSQIALKTETQKALYGDMLFPINVVFGLFILFYFNRFD